MTTTNISYKFTCTAQSEFIAVKEMLELQKITYTADEATLIITCTIEVSQ